jgi:hypothetical protein
MAIGGWRLVTGGWHGFLLKLASSYYCILLFTP